MEHVYFRRLSFITAFLFLSSAVWSFFLGGMGFGEALEPVGSSWGSLSFSLFFSMGFDIFNGVCMVASGASPEEALLWSGGLSHVS